MKGRVPEKLRGEGSGESFREKGEFGKTVCMRGSRVQWKPRHPRREGGRWYGRQSQTKKPGKKSTKFQEPFYLSLIICISSI